MMRFMVLEVWWHTYLSLNSLWSIAAAIIQWHKARSYIVRSSMTEWNSPGMMSGSLICTTYEGILTCTRTMVKHDHYRRWCVHSITPFCGWLFWPTNEPANIGLFLGKYTTQSYVQILRKGLYVSRLKEVQQLRSDNEQIYDSHISRSTSANNTIEQWWRDYINYSLWKSIYSDKRQSDKISFKSTVHTRRISLKDITRAI